MCLTNAIDVSYDMTGAKHVLWRTHCCRRTSTNEFRWANVLNECEQMCLTNVNKCAWRMRLTVAMTWLELNMYFGTVGVYQQVLASIYIYIYAYIYIYMYIYIYIIYIYVLEFSGRASRTYRLLRIHYIYLYIYMHIYIYILRYIYI